MGTESHNPLSGLGSTRSTYRLNQIDKVRANGVGDQISLPQLVVCGDQSSGKSSVLERITGIPFPREEGLCTRFPTEIILRHSSEPLRLTASIRPSAQRSLKEQKILQAYHRTLTDMTELPDVIGESARLMGLRGHGQDPDTDQTANAFAHDVLRIEIVGPVGLHLTIVDLPGLISVANEQQTEDDVRMVTEIVQTYLASTRTIIMAVVQASNDVANQRVIQLARKYDADGGRTVGIITKPDLINDGTEHRIAQLAKNRDAVKLKLGFFLVKNPSPSENSSTAAELSSDESGRRERAFFDKPAWKEQKLAADRVGIDALRLFLQVLLDRHIEKELPKVRREIKRLLATKEEELLAMGAQRQSSSDVRLFLTRMSMRFRGLAEAAVDGKYAGMEADFFKRPGTRLRAEVHEANGGFAEKMRVQGHLRTVKKSEGSDEPSGEPYSGSSGESRESGEEDTESTDEIGEDQIAVTEEEMTAWVRKVYKSTRGRELPGSHNHVLLAELFQEQSSLWPSLASDHIQAIFRMVMQWTSQATEVCVDEENVRQEVSVLCQNAWDKVQKLAVEEMQKLVADERGHPITYNHYYTDNIQKARLDKQKAALQQTLSNVKAAWDGVIHVANVPADFERLLSAMSENTTIEADMNERACKEALDELAAYYKVAMKTFVDNICRQVVERHVMTALPELFSPSTVATFGDEELMRIGSETEAQRAKRAELDALVHGLRQSLVDLHGPA